PPLMTASSCSWGWRVRSRSSPVSSNGGYEPALRWMTVSPPFPAAWRARGVVAKGSARVPGASSSPVGDTYKLFMPYTGLYPKPVASVDPVEWLWRDGGGEPARGLSVDAIVRAGIEVADAEGLAG